jgi:hypothetical protein
MIRDRDVGRVRTWHDEDWDMKAWQDEDEDRRLGTRDDNKNEIVL